MIKFVIVMILLFLYVNIYFISLLLKVYFLKNRRIFYVLFLLIWKELLGIFKMNKEFVVYFCERKDLLMGIVGFNLLKNKKIFLGIR